MGAGTLQRFTGELATLKHSTVTRRTGEGLEQASVFGTVGGPPKVFLRKEEVLDAISRKFRDVGRHGVTRWYVSTNGGPEWKWLQDALDKKVELWHSEP